MRLLAHTWSWKDNNTDVSYEFTPRGPDVLLVIVHRRLEGRELAVMGGDMHTGILEDLLKGVEPRPFWKTHVRLGKEYGATL